METLRNGKFSEVLDFRDLSGGLRSSENQARNLTGGFEDLSGLVGKDGGLVVIDSITRLVTTVITDAFPYPQIFNLANRVLVCGATKIYELSGSTLTLKITASVSGSTWVVIDYVEFIYMTNGKVAITRNPMSGVYAESSVLPMANAGVNFNGQAMVGGM